jgi:hypothetical protein
LEPSPNAVNIGAIRNLLKGLIFLHGHLRLYGNNNTSIVRTFDRLLGFIDKLFAAEETVAFTWPAIPSCDGHETAPAVGCWDRRQDDSESKPVSSRQPELC